jgi:hypothetical protein
VAAYLLANISSPLAWAIRILAFGKKIKTSTTSHGFTTWSEDQETLEHKDIECTMSQFARLRQANSEELRHPCAAFS